MKPITIQNSVVTIKPILGNTTNKEVTLLKKGVYNIFSDGIVMRMYPEKMISTTDQAELWLSRTIMGYQTGVSSNHFIHLKATGEVIGVIEVTDYKALASNPSRSQMFRHYPELKECIEIEYWLNSNYWGNGIMSNTIKAFTNEALKQHIPAITAFVLSNNLSSQAVLKKAGFIKVGELPSPDGTSNHHYVKTRVTN